MTSSAEYVSPGVTAAVAVDSVSLQKQQLTEEPVVVSGYTPQERITLKDLEAAAED